MTWQSLTSTTNHRSVCGDTQKTNFFPKRLFKKSSERIFEDKRPTESELSFGVRYLDDALRGIAQDDFILIGAPTGVGKTQFCTNLALANARKKKRVHMFALEAAENEIEDRIKYSLLADKYFNSVIKPALPKKLNFADWKFRKFDEVLKDRFDIVNEFADLEYLHTMYKKGDFTVETLEEQVFDICLDSDLVIIDHAHYFDYDDESENKALKVIAKTCRKLVLELKTPVVLVSHLRKSNKQFREIVPGIDEFHGSSDLTKIATRVITLAKGKLISPGKSETFLRVCKDRYDGSTTNYIGCLIYNFQKNEYEKHYTIGKLNYEGNEFIEITNPMEEPLWMTK